MNPYRAGEPRTPVQFGIEQYWGTRVRLCVRFPCSIPTQDDIDELHSYLDEMFSPVDVYAPKQAYK